MANSNGTLQFSSTYRMNPLRCRLIKGNSLGSNLLLLQTSLLQLATNAEQVNSRHPAPGVECLLARLH